MSEAPARTAAFDSSGDAVAAAAILATARCWIESAAAQMPEEFRASFRDRNPVNRLLLARAPCRPLNPDASRRAE